MSVNDSNNSKCVVEVKKKMYSRKMSLARFYKILTFICFGMTALFILLLALPIPNAFYNLEIIKFFVVQFFISILLATITANLASFLDWSDKSTRRLFTSIMCSSGSYWILVNAAFLLLVKIRA